MAMSDADQNEATRYLAGRIFPPGVTANLDLNDLKAAIASIDATMNALASTITQAQTVLTNFVQRLPEPFKGNTNAQQKTLALVSWALKNAGII